MCLAVAKEIQEIHIVDIYNTLAHTNASEWHHANGETPVRGHQDAERTARQKTALATGVSMR